VTTEYDLTCARCGSPLSRAEVSADHFEFSDAAGSVEVAECADCGGQYFPETSLERLG
jgi:hypothetical protein